MTHDQATAAESATQYRRPCTFPRCTRPDYALRLCTEHYTKNARIRAHRGDADKVSTTPIRKHVRLLRRRGWTWQGIASAGRTSSMMLHRIMRGRQPLMRRDKVARILAIEPVWQHTDVTVHLTGTKRRLDALAWQGWSNRAVAAQLGICQWTVPNAARTWRVTANVAALIAGFYDQHAYRPGPDPKHAKKARTQGCLPAWVWEEDESIDDPSVRPRGIDFEAVTG